MLSPAPEFFTPYQGEKIKRNISISSPILMKKPRLSCSFDNGVVDLTEDRDNIDSAISKDHGRKEKSKET